MQPNTFMLSLFADKKKVINVSESWYFEGVLCVIFFIITCMCREHEEGEAFGGAAWCKDQTVSVEG